MALEFNPPNWLIQDYMNRKSPGQQVLDTALQAGNDLANYQALKQQQALTQEQRDIDKAKAVADGGQDFADAYAKIHPATPQTPSLIDRAKAFFGGGQKQQPMNAVAQAPQVASASPMPSLGGYQPPMQSTGTAPSPQGPPVPQNFLTPQGQLDQPAMDAYKKQHGNKGIADLEKQLSLSNTLQTAKAKQEETAPASFDEVGITFDAAGKPELGKRLVDNAKKLGQTNVQRKSYEAALKGLAVANTGVRGGALDSMAATRENALRLSMNKDARETLSPLFQKGEGRNQMVILNRIGRVEPLIDQMMSQKGGGDARQMREMATSMDRIIRGGGQSAQSQIDELMPDTARGKFAHWQEWFTNNPTGTEQKAFINRYADTVKREKDVVQGQVKKMAEKNASTLRLLKQNYPEDYQSQVDAVMSNAQLVGNQEKEVTTGMEHLTDEELQRIINGQ